LTVNAVDLFAHEWRGQLVHEFSERNLIEEIVDELEQDGLPLLSGLGNHFFVEKPPVLIEEFVSYAI
jgi:hypothetical protein